MKKKLLSNFSLKLMSVVVAVVVWLLVVNADDPYRAVTLHDVVVQVQNEAYVESGGQMCMIEEGQDIISVEVWGRRSVVDSLTAGDIEATADLKQISNWDTDPIMVPISLSCPGITSQNLTANPVNLSIQLDDMMTQEFLITVTTDGSQPGTGYEVGAVKANPGKVKITGPKSLMNKIDRVVAAVDVTGLTEDATVSSDLQIIDKNQEPLDTQMSYLKYDISAPQVDVEVDLWSTVSDIKLQSGYVGNPEDGYKVEKITITPESVSLAGTDEALAELAKAGNEIVIPDDMIDVSDHNEDFEVEINIEQLLPENVILTRDTTDTALAAISVMPQDSREYTLSTTTIQAQNVASDQQVVYETDSIQIRVREGTKELDNLRGTDIKATIDCTGKTAGSYDMPVTITLPEGYELVDQVSTAVKITDSAGN